MYYNLFNLLAGYIYGADAILTGDQELTLTIISTLGVLFVVCLPFLVIWRFIRMFV